MVKDPVCGIILDYKSPCKSSYAGQIHAFCCPTCKTRFDMEPERYTNPTGVMLIKMVPPKRTLASPFMVIASIGHVLQFIFPKSGSTNAQERTGWLYDRGRSRDSH